MYNYVACLDFWGEYFIIHKIEELACGGFRYTVLTECERL